MHVQYGCGLSAPKEWRNYDISPTLRIQKIPLIGKLILKAFHPVMFPDNVKYGNIIKGLPGIKNGSCKAVYCSHTLEHLALNDFRIALKKSYDMLEPGGIFRCVVPDLEFYARNYVKSLDNNADDANMEFLNLTYLGQKNRLTGFKGMITEYFGNADHRWMWDEKSMARELKDAGFNNVRRAQFNDSKDDMFLHVEEKGRFDDCLAMESIK